MVSNSVKGEYMSIEILQDKLIKAAKMQDVDEMRRLVRQGANPIRPDQNNIHAIEHLMAGNVEKGKAFFAEYMAKMMRS